MTVERSLKSVDTALERFKNAIAPVETCLDIANPLVWLELNKYWIGEAPLLDAFTGTLEGLKPDDRKLILVRLHDNLAQLDRAQEQLRRMVLQKPVSGAVRQ